MSRTRSILSCALVFAVAACAKKNQAEVPPKTPPPLAKSGAAEDGEEPTEPLESALPWAKEAYSPQPGSTPEPSLEKAEAKCGAGDAALHDVAQLLSEIQVEEGEGPALDVAKFHLMRRGSPYVMPRMWSAVVQGKSPEQVADSIGTWAKERPPLGEYRCGLGMSEMENGAQVITALQVDVLAEIKPIPTRVESGTWLDFEAKLLVPASSATVLLLPPEGPPKHLQTDLVQGRARTRFAIETEGPWLIQLMATGAGGPRPVAQTMVTADQDPPSSLDERPVPGEKAFDKKKSQNDALFELMNAAREDQGLPRVKRNKKLDRAAEEHSRAMVEQGRISHDTGAGNPAYRLELKGMTPKATGENVAMAGSVVRLHRVLWASPAHRENLLLRRWDEAGISIVDDGSGSLYATQLFIDTE